MADLAEKKIARSNQKRKVTKCISKLNSSLIYCSDCSLLKERADTLEDEYDKLDDLHEECLELGADDENYLQDITNSMQECMKSYFNSVKAEKEKNQIKEAAPLKNLIERDFSRVQSIIERIQMTLGLEFNEVKENHIYEVGEDLSIMSSRVNALLDNVANLTKLVEDNAALEEKVSSLMNKTDRVSRDAKVFIKTHQNIESFQRPISSLSKEDISITLADHETQVLRASLPSTTMSTSDHVATPILNPQATTFLPSSSVGLSTSVVTATQA